MKVKGKVMVGAWGLEPQTSTVSMWTFMPDKQGKNRLDLVREWRMTPARIAFG